MADSKNVIKKKSYVYLHKLKAAVCILAFAITTIQGGLAQVPPAVIAWRGALAIVVIALVCRILVTILQRYEEIE